MKLDDLKNGDVVVLKNGERYMKVDGFFVGHESEGLLLCDTYAQDMKLKDRYDDNEFDIEKVYRCKLYRFSIANFPDKYMIWSRDEENVVDWSEVEVDTEILVKGTINRKWLRRYFAKFENGKVYAWVYGATSWSAHDSLSWDFAKLAESEEKE